MPTPLFRPLKLRQEHAVALRQCVGAVEDHFQTAIPETLWHYTNKASFEGIILNGAFWATHIRFLNDTDEFIHIQAFTKKWLESERMKTALPSTQEMLNALVLHQFSDGILSEKELELYVVSFSGAENDLTQFRLYSELCKGVSLGFDLRGLRPPMGMDTAIRFAPCIYEDDEKSALLSVALGAFADDSDRLFHDTNDRR